MNCSDAERLFDAFLDRELSGTLRLELDAHRLRCRRCQQTLAMLESCGDVIASDRGGPLLDDDFAERVMADIADRQDSRPRIYRFRATRVAAVVGTLIPAAAVLVIAVLFSNSDSTIAPPSDVNVDHTALTMKSDVDVRAGAEAIWEKFGPSIRATTYLTEGVLRTAKYLSLEVGEALAAASAEQQHGGIFGLFGAFWSAPSLEASEPEAEVSDQFSL